MNQQPTTLWARYRAAARGNVGVLLALFSGAFFAAHAAAPPNGVAPVTTPNGGFAIDGNLLANTAVNGVGDWIAMTHLYPGAGGGVLASNGTPLNAITTFHFLDPYASATDTIITGGDANANPNAWTWGRATVLNKEDMNNGLVHIGRDSSNHVWVIVSADHTGTGDADMYFYFLQNTLIKNANGTFASAGPHAGFTMSDLRLKLNFSGDSFLADQWQTNTGSGGGYRWADVSSSLPTGRVFMAVNPGNTYVPYTTFGSTNCPVGDFVEAAADFSALVGNIDPCASIGFHNVFLATLHPSGTMSDFIDPIPAIINIGLAADAGADQTICYQGALTTFSLNGAVSVDGTAAVSTNWSVVSGEAIIGSPGSLKTTVQVPSSTAGTKVTLRLTVTSACTNKADDVVLNVAALPPPCLIAGAAAVCPRSTNQFSSPVGANSYAWSLVGNGRIIGPTNQPTIQAVAGTNCGPSFTLALLTVTNICTISCSTDVAVVDTGAPVLACPPDVFLECPAITTTNTTGVATATDGCSRATVKYDDTETTVCGGTKIIARTWTATDECGNSTNCVQTITVRDRTAPVISCPPNRTLQCPADTTPNSTGTATATDACSAFGISYRDVTSNSCGGTLTLWRTWTALDSCSNAASCVQLITLRDTNAPTIFCPTNVTLECPADTSTNRTGVATASDTCGATAISFTDATTSQCGNSYVIARRWTATDACGNQSTCTQTITVRDTRPPVLTCPPDRTLECPADPRTNVTGVATATDACGSATITFSDATNFLCGKTMVITRTWTATDPCTNRSSCVQTIRVADTEPPTILCPTNRIVECGVTWTFGSPTASDTCGTNNIVLLATVTNAGCGNTFTAIRTWRATDACGNFADCSQTVRVVDTTPPVIVCPALRAIECPNPLILRPPTASDICGTVRVEMISAVTNIVCGTTIQVEARWRATDACGNFSDCTSFTRLVDNTPPVITCVGSKTVECRAPWTFDQPAVTDTCGATTLIISETTTNARCGQTFTATRYWLATDACGNEAECSQTVTVVDTAPPLITCAGPKTVQCGDTWTFDPPTATDSCGAITLTISETTTNARCGQTFTATRYWLAADACGNEAECSQTVTVLDTRAPTITCVAGKTVQCGAAWTFDPPTATDLCGTNLITITGTVTNPACGNTFTATRTWRATDGCGNFAPCSQTVTVIDTTAPVISCPPSLTVECTAPTTTNATGVASATDNCGVPAITFSDSVSNACGITKTIFRTWRATDQCNNSSTCVQTITVRDLTPPVLTCPTNVVVECGASTLPAATGTATATDICGTPTVTFTDVVAPLCGGTRIITRTWTATDVCNNRSSCAQTITVRDTTPPALTLPVDRVIECPGDTRTNATGVATAQDICGSVAITYSEVVSNACGLTRTIQRLWTATDQCGNSTNGLQTIRVVDTLQPRITCPSLAVQCADDVPAPYGSLAAFQAAGGTAADNCDSALTFSLTSAGGLVGSCPGTVTRVYRVTDDCGNFSACTQTIVVDDTIAPALTCAPNLTIECNTSLDPALLGHATAVDNCATNVPITYSDALVPSSYSVDFFAADPGPNSAPFMPTYLRLGPASLPCPESARLTGRAADPLRNAVAYGPTANDLDALTSLGGEPMSLGQIVPFEVIIGASGGPGPENGTIEFTASWSTHTTSNDEFGYDKNYRVYCAFVDTADPGTFDPAQNARVTSITSTLVGVGTVDEKFLGTIRVTGLDVGDRVIVEIWVVLMSSRTGQGGGTIASDFVSAQKVLNPPVPLTTGGKTISIGNLSKITPLPAPQPQPPAPGPLPPAIPDRLVSVIDRTWAGTDDCGNRGTCVQRLTVRDTTPPVITAPHLVLECPAETDPNATGVAVVQDACGGPATVTYSDTTINGCFGNLVVSRRWTATDSRSNTTNLVQTITVRDTTPPTLTVGANRTINAGEPMVFNPVSATDTCTFATVAELGTVTNNLGSQIYDVTRTWKATDACRNAVTNRQTISIINPPPQASLVSVQGRTMTLRWPAYAADYRLESSVDLNRWSPVPIAPVLSNGWWYVEVPITATPTFYRLGNTPPALEALVTTPGRVTLTWPTAPAGFLLEASDNLQPPNWSPLAVTPTSSNRWNYVDLSADGTWKFFRLKKTQP